MKIYRRSAAPSPDSPEASKGYRSFRSGLPQTPPRLSPSSKRLRQRRSVRIPDFAQLLFEIKVNKSDGTLDYPLSYRAGVLLLVEIKKATSSCQIFDFLSVLDQTDEQARHAFASYPRVNTFGLIVALGNRWIYREYYRKDLSPSPIRTTSERLDPTFVDSNSDSDMSTLQSRTCADVEDIFKTTGFARLQSNTSNNALAAVRKRLGTLAFTMFRSGPPPGCNCYCCFCLRVTALKFLSRIVISTHISLLLPVVVLVGWCS